MKQLKYEDVITLFNKYKFIIYKGELYEISKDPGMGEDEFTLNRSSVWFHFIGKTDGVSATESNGLYKKIKLINKVYLLRNETELFLSNKDGYVNFIDCEPAKLV